MTERTYPDYSTHPEPKLKCLCGKLLTKDDGCPLIEGTPCPLITKSVRRS